MSTAIFSNASVFCKSEKGIDEMATRKHGLPPKLRSILILIDGKRPFSDLAKLVASFGPPQELLGKLVDDGFVRPQAGGSSGITQAVAEVTASPAAAIDADVRTIALASRHAVRFLNDQMGPMAETLCLRIEAAKTFDEFIAAIARAQGVLGNARSKALAERFATEVADKTPIR